MLRLVAKSSEMILQAHNSFTKAVNRFTTL